MSDGFRSTGDSASQGAGGSGSGGAFSGVLRTGVYLGLIVALAATALAMFRASQDRATMKQTGDRLAAVRGIITPARKRLSREYSDKDGRMLADPPIDPSKLLDPDAIVLAHYQDADAETQLVDWDAFQAHLSKVTGKEVLSQEYRNSLDDVAAIKAGKIQIIALHAADAPYVVNNAGFIPVGVLGNEAGANGNHLAIAVAAQSKIQNLPDLRGHTLTCTAPHSMTGYRAAIVVLAEEAGLRLDEDYSINFSLGQKRSILGLMAGDFEVAALSEDKVESLLEKGSIKPSDYRVIYRSQVIPRLTIGYTYNLKPELAAKVTSAVLDFINEGGAPDESTNKPMRFFAIDYKKDFEFVRKIDDCFDPRFYKAPKEEPGADPSATPPPEQTTSLLK